MGVIHNRCAIVSARYEIMIEAKRVSYLMSSKLAQPGESHFFHFRRSRFSGFIGSEQALRNQIILPYALGTQRHVPLNYFARSGIDHSAAVRPAAGVAMHPFDNVVTNIHGICALR